MTSDDLRPLYDFKERLDRELRALFAWARADIREASEGPSGAILLDGIESLTLRGGKRLRPYLAWHAAACVDDPASVPGLLPTCAALELLQTYLLIHDDIMDGDEIRRGGPTVHVLLGAKDAEQGRMLAILAGDLACTLARRGMERAEISADRKVVALDELARMEWEVIQGQVMDLLGSPDVRTMHDLKTGSYTTRGPVRFGGALAGASTLQVAALEAFANPLGLAFQLRDDLLDVTGDPAKTGKAVGIDLREGRMSAVIDEALRRAEDSQRAVIEAARGNTGMDDAQLEAALAAIAESGALDACARRVRDWTEQAVAALDPAALREEGRAGLVSIARALAARVS